MTPTQKLIDTIARLNPDVGEIGAGMLASLVADAKAIQSQPATGAPDALPVLAELVACEELRLSLYSMRSDPYYVTQADAMEGQYEKRMPRAWEAARKVLAGSPAPAKPMTWAEAIEELTPSSPAPVPAEEMRLSIHEQRAVLSDLQGLECLINHHDCEEVKGDVMEPGMGAGNARRALELLELGRQIIAADPELWSEEQKAPFKLRHSERAANTETPDFFVTEYIKKEKDESCTLIREPFSKYPDWSREFLKKIGVI